MTLTGSLLQELALCELRGTLQARHKRRDSDRARYISEARRIARLARGYCSSRLCLERRMFEGEIYGYPFASSPDIVLLDRETGFIIGVVRARIRSGLRARRLDYIRLILDAYGAISSGVASNPLYMIVVVALSPSSLLTAIRSLADRFNGFPYSESSYSVNVRVYREEEALPLLRRAVDVINGRARPRANPGPACSFCPFREECPYASPAR